MMESEGPIVTDKRGVSGRISTRIVDPDSVAVDVGGAILLVPRNALHVAGPSSYTVGFSFEGLPSVSPQAEPVVESPAPNAPPSGLTQSPPMHPAHLIFGHQEITSIEMPKMGEVPVMPPLEAYADNPPKPATRESASNKVIDQVDSEIVLPVIEESLVVDKREVESGAVRVHKHVQVEDRLVEMPLEIEEVSVERVPVNRIADGPVAVREEGDVTIIPLVEEILVVEKRLLVREEIRLTKTRRTIQSSQTVQIRREEAEVERVTKEPDSTPDAGNIG